MKKLFTLCFFVISNQKSQKFISYSNNEGLKSIDDLVKKSFNKSLKSPGTESVKNIMKFAK